MAGRLTVVLSAAIVMLCRAVTAAANPLDAGGYIMNWQGPVSAQFNSSPLPIQPPQSLSQILSMAISQSIFCEGVKSAVLSVGKSQVSSFDSCSIPSSFELRGMMLGTNELGLKIILNDVKFSFTATTATDPKINVTATVEIDSGIGFMGAIDGSMPNSTTPMSALAASVTMSNVNVTTNNIITNLFGGSALTNLSKEIASQQGPNGNLTTQLNNAVDTQNPALYTDAVNLSNLIVKSKDPNANSFFFLAVNIDANQNLVIDFQRNGTAPLAPTDCVLGSISYAIVTAKCSTTTSTGSVTFDQLDQMMLFRLDTAASRPNMPAYDLADDGVDNSWDVPAPRWAVPFLQDSYFQEVPNPPGEATYHVCAQNLFGRGCGPDMKVTLNLKVAPVAPASSPACGPNSHPYTPCRAFQLNSQAIGPGGMTPQRQP
jgi:hypothetical protein